MTRGRKRLFVHNRDIIEADLESFNELVKTTKGFSKITEITNKRLLEKGNHPVSQSVVYRAIVRKQLPSEYISYIIIDSCKDFVKEINTKTQKILANFEI